MVAGTTCPECTDKEIRERLVRIETLLASEHELNIPARVASLEAEGDFANGTPTHRQARGHGPCPAHGQENREDQGSTKDDSRGMRGIGQDSQKSDSEPRRRRRLYVSEDGTRCDTDTALEREWKSGAEASFRSDRNSGSALGARHDTEHEAGRRGTDYVLRKMARAIIPWIKWEL